MMELARSLGALAKRGVRPQAHDRVRELGRRGIHADVVHRVGRAACGRARRARGGLSERRQLRVGQELRLVGGPVAEPGDQGSHRGRHAIRTRSIDRGGVRAVHARGQRVARRRQLDLVNNRLGSGSDYTVFLNFLGVPIADLSFTGPYGVYHSVYDNHAWVAKFGDPGFRYHAAMARLWGVLALRLANADVVPLDYRSVRGCGCAISSTK